MKLLFVNDNPRNDYNADSPFEQSLAGSESAQVYLAIELAKRGHQVHLYNATTKPGMHRGVDCRALSDMIDDLDDFDAVLVTNGPEFARSLRARVTPRTPIVAWEHNNLVPDSAYSQALAKLVGTHDYILCVSDWHRDEYIRRGNLDPGRVLVLRNAISPHFVGLFDDGDDILASKARPPGLSFTSAPYKGLAPAITLFKALRQRHASVTLAVYSGLDHYSPGAYKADPKWQAMYQDCRATPGIDYIGPLPQADLARALIPSLALFYPGIVAETSSIVAMESMAAGCVVIAPAFGALPETMAGFGELIDAADGNIALEDFIRRTVLVLSQHDRGDDELGERLMAQVGFVNEYYRWHRRAAEMEQHLLRICAAA